MRYAIWVTNDYVGDPCYHVTRVESPEDMETLFSMRDAIAIEAQSHGQALDRFIEQRREEKEAEKSHEKS